MFVLETDKLRTHSQMALVTIAIHASVGKLRESAVLGLVRTAALQSMAAENTSDDASLSEHETGETIPLDQQKREAVKSWTTTPQ